MPDEFKRPHPDEIPASVDEALDVLAQIVPQETLDKIVAMDEDELVLLHFSLGAAIRNQFSLWDPKSPLMADLVARQGKVRPDDASAVLIDLLRAKLRRG